MFCFGRTSFLAVLLIWGGFAAESSCTDRNQTTQNSSSSVTEVNTTVSAQMGTKVLLCCSSIPLKTVVLITWIITPRGRPSCIIAYKAETRDTNETNCLGRSITWASAPDHSPDLQISAVALQHEGLYSCDMATPEGNFQKVYDLQVLVAPEVTYFPGKNRTAVCEAIAGKPAAQISWTPDGDCVTKNESHSNGTVTVRSTCHWEQSNVSAVSCSVSHSTGNQTLVIELSGGENVNCQNLKLLQLLRRMKCSLMLATQRRAIHSMILWPRWRHVQCHKVKSTAQIGLLCQRLESRTKKKKSRDIITTALLSLKFCNGMTTWKLVLPKFLGITNVLMDLHLSSSIIGSLESLLLAVNSRKN